MPLRGLWSGLIFLGCTGVLSACSSSHDESNGSQAGSSAAGRQGASGSSGRAPGSGGTLATGTGGTVANPQGCPAQAPVEGVVCSGIDTQCNYAGMDCTCEAVGADDDVSAGWNCRRAAQMCPAAVPANGSSCTPGRGDCTIGATTCACPEETQTWACWDPADCPATLPDERAPCDLVAMECEYQNAQGNGDDCECTASGWDCGRQVCPATLPAAGGECEGGDGTCAFGSQVCDCRQRMWLCWDPADCPAAPAHQAACSLERMICEYTGGECECEDGAWSCDDELITGTGTDADAGV